MHPDKIFIYVNDRCISLTEFAAMKQEDIRTVDARGCTGLTELKAENARTVDASSVSVQAAE